MIGLSSHSRTQEAKKDRKNRLVFERKKFMCHMWRCGALKSLIGIDQTTCSGSYNNNS